MKGVVLSFVLAGLVMAGCGRPPEPCAPKEKSRYSKTNKCKKNRRYQDNLH